MKVVSAPPRWTGDVSRVDDGALRRGPRFRARWAVASAVTVALVVAVALRFATRSDLWLDEALSVNVARLPLSQIPSWLRHDGAPPLYYFLLHFWTNWFGTSDLAVRSLSGVLSVATLPPMWFAGRRIAGKPAAWAAVLIIALSPFAIRYATETRMYSLQMLLVVLGYLALQRLLERPSFGRQAALAVITGLLLYTQYWALYLFAVVGALLVLVAWRAQDAARRRAARSAIVALTVGGITFLPWVPTFLYQSAHTGTPWGRPVAPSQSFVVAVRDFAGGVTSEASLFLFLAAALTVLAITGRAVDRYHIDLDVRTRPGSRGETFVWVSALLLGAVASYASKLVVVSRYASVVFPLVVLVMAAGVTVFANPRVRVGVIAALVAVSLVSTARVVPENRTQAAQVANVIRGQAKPGDVVVYCPDQVGPAVDRLLRGRHDLEQLTFPRGDGPQLVDWVDYYKRRHRADTDAFARDMLTRTGTGHTLWYVLATNYEGGNQGRCQAIRRAFKKERPGARLLVKADEQFFEPIGLIDYPGA